MDGHWRGKGHRVEAIEHAAVAVDYLPPVLDATVALAPQKPMLFIASAISAACHGLNGVIQNSAAPSAVALATPPIRPSQVFEGDSAGAKGAELNLRI